MLYPQKGSMANGSRRRTPTVPVAAAVVSDASVAPRKVPCDHEKDSYTRGMTPARRAPNKITPIGPPPGLSHSFEELGHCRVGAGNRRFGGGGRARLPPGHPVPVP